MVHWKSPHLYYFFDPQLLKAFCPYCYFSQLLGEVTSFLQTLFLQVVSSTMPRFGPLPESSSAFIFLSPSSIVHSMWDLLPCATLTDRLWPFSCSVTLWMVLCSSWDHAQLIGSQFPRRISFICLDGMKILEHSVFPRSPKSRKPFYGEWLFENVTLVVWESPAVPQKSVLMDWFIYILPSAPKMTVSR